MNRFLQRHQIILPLTLLMFLATSCSKHNAKVAFYTFCFYLIFIVLCLPGVILSGVARGNGSKSARTTGIVFTSIGGFFGMIYTYNVFEDLRRVDDEILLYLFLMWGVLIGSLIMIVIPNPKMKNQDELRAQQYQQYQQESRIFNTEAEIVEYAEQIKKQQASQPTPDNSPYLNDDLSDPKKDQQGPDMSGLDDLADL